MVKVFVIVAILWLRRLSSNKVGTAVLSLS